MLLAELTAINLHVHVSFIRVISCHSTVNPNFNCTQGLYPCANHPIRHVIMVQLSSFRVHLVFMGIIHYIQIYSPTDADKKKRNVLIILCEAVWRLIFMYSSLSLHVRDGLGVVCKEPHVSVWSPLPFPYHRLD